MKGYIYTMYRGADPGKGWGMTDPIFGRVPTLGACMPNVRRVVTPGDHIFVISGHVEGIRQYVVGTFQVEEKITAMAAYKRFPENRQQRIEDGSLAGNIIVDSAGNRSRIDYHSNFEKRVQNYIVGRNPLVLETADEISRARTETLDVISSVFQKTGQRVLDIIGRWRRLDDFQIAQMLNWMQGLK